MDSVGKRTAAFTAYNEAILFSVKDLNPKKQMQMNNLHLLFIVFFFHVKKVVEKVLLGCSDGNVDGEVTGSELLLVLSWTVWCSRAGAQGNEPENIKSFNKWAG